MFTKSILLLCLLISPVLKGLEPNHAENAEIAQFLMEADANIIPAMIPFMLGVLNGVSNHTVIQDDIPLEQAAESA